MEPETQCNRYLDKQVRKGVRKQTCPTPTGVAERDCERNEELGEREAEEPRTEEENYYIWIFYNRGK